MKQYNDSQHASKSMFNINELVKATVISSTTLFFLIYLVM